MADDGGEIQRLTTVFDADYSKLNAKLDAVIRAQYGAAQKVQDAWKKAQASSAADQAIGQAASLKNIQLENQLTIARATGNRAQIAALTEQIRLQQQLAILKRAGVTGAPALAQASAHVSALALAERAAEAPNLARAGRSVLDASRFATLEQGGAKLRVFGSALEPLGAYGIAAAAGVLALSEALAQSHEAIEYADGLYKAAQAAHVTTDELQVMRIALEKAGGQAQEADGALLEFSTTFGKAQDGLKRNLRGFTALGLDPKAFQDSGAALDAVVAKIQNLRKPSDQDAAIDLLGLRGLAPLILAGADAWKKYREEAAKAVLPAEVVARGHELNVQIDELTRKIKLDLTEAFINLGPILEGLVSLIAKITGGVKVFTDKLAEWARDPAVQAMIDISTGGVISAESVNKFGVGAISEKAGPPPSLETLQGLIKTYFTPKTGKLADLTPKGSDQTLSFDRKASDAYDANIHALAEAQAALITGLHEHAEAEKASVDDDLRKKIHDLTLDEAEIRKSTKDARKAEQLSAVEAAKIAAQLAAADKKALIDRQTAVAALAEVVRTRDFIGGQQSRIAGNAAAEQPTAAERNAIERASLLAQQQLALKDFDAESYAGRAGKSDYVDPNVVGARSDLELYNSNRASERGALVAGQQSDVAKQAFDQAGPLDKYLRGIQDLNTAFQQDGVEAISQLSSVLEQMGEHTKQAGSILEHWLLELALKMVSQEFTAAAAPALAAGAKGVLAILGLAGGGEIRGPGSSTSDSIPIMASDGEYMVNAKATREHRPLLEAINSGKVGRFAQGGVISRSAFPGLHAASSMSASRAGGVTVVQPVHFHAEGAVVTQDLLDQAQDGANRAAASMGQWARSGAVSDVQRLSYGANLNQ